MTGFLLAVYTVLILEEKSHHCYCTGNHAYSTQVEAVTDPSNISIKEDIMRTIQVKKDEVNRLRSKSNELIVGSDFNKEVFLNFAFDFIENIGSNFIDSEAITPEERLRCKEAVFPAGFHIDANNNVYTPKVRILYRLATQKKDTEVSEKSLLVRVRRL